MEGCEECVALESLKSGDTLKMMRDRLGEFSGVEELGHGFVFDKNNIDQ